MSKVKEFIVSNFKSVILLVSFIVTMYVQHLNNTAQIAQLEKKNEMFEKKLQEQYEKIDAMKLDKTVFEATIAQFSTIGNDIREIRSDIKEILKKR